MCSPRGRPPDRGTRRRTLCSHQEGLPAWSTGWGWEVLEIKRLTLSLKKEQWKWNVLPDIDSICMLECPFMLWIVTFRSKGTPIGLEKKRCQSWTFKDGKYSLFFKIKVRRVKFNWRSEDGDCALFVLVAERLVLGEALRDPGNLFAKISNISVGVNEPCNNNDRVKQLN